MKKLFYSAVVITALLTTSCTPTTPVTPSTNNVVIGPQPKFQFKANGTLYILDAVFDNRIGWTGYPYLDNVDEPGFSLSAVPGGQTSIDVSFPSPNNINVGTYNNPNLIGVQTPDFINITSSTNGTFNLIITRVSNGTADGTFFGTVWPASNPTNIVNITEGTFSNIPVIN